MTQMPLTFADFDDITPGWCQTSCHMSKIKKLLSSLPLAKGRKARLSQTQIRRLRMEPDFIEMVQCNDCIDKFSETLYTTYKTTEYIVANNIPGAFVECGVYKGRHISMMALTLSKLDQSDRDIYLYDTFAGMTKPGTEDVRRGHKPGQEDLVEKWEAHQRDGHNLIRYAGLEEVRDSVFSTGYPEDKFHFIAGDIRETVPNELHPQIALLRLDTDWYELTKHELNHMYELLVPGGLLIIDDYGSHEGARKAVDQFFAERNSTPMLFRTSKAERAMIKPV